MAGKAYSMDNLDIYNYDKRFEQVLRQLKNELSGTNFEIIPK